MDRRRSPKVLDTTQSTLVNLTVTMNNENIEQKSLYAVLHAVYIVKKKQISRPSVLVDICLIPIITTTTSFLLSSYLEYDVTRITSLVKPLIELVVPLLTHTKK